jgi:hypothetical protein
VSAQSSQPEIPRKGWRCLLHAGGGVSSARVASRVVRRDSDRRPSTASRTGRESLGASHAGARLSGSAADDEQADDEDEEDELQGDAYGVLEAALQTGVGDGDPYGEESSPATTRSAPSQVGTRRLTMAAAPKSRKATPSRTRK